MTDYSFEDLVTRKTQSWFHYGFGLGFGLTLLIILWIAVGPFRSEPSDSKPTADSVAVVSSQIKPGARANDDQIEKTDASASLVNQLADDAAPRSHDDERVVISLPRLEPTKAETSDPGPIQEVTAVSRRDTFRSDADSDEPTDGITLSVPETRSSRVPTQGELKLGVEALQKKYADDYKGLHLPHHHRALALKLLTDSLNLHAEESPTAMYCGVAESVRNALNGGDWLLALYGLDRLAQVFDLNTTEKKLQVLQGAVDFLTASELSQLGQVAGRLTVNAWHAENWTTAEELLKLASLNRRDRAQLQFLNWIVKERQRAHREYTRARDTLFQRPDDEVARMIVGRYECLYRQQWSNAELLSLAEKQQSPLLRAASLSLQETELQPELSQELWRAAARLEKGGAQIMAMLRGHSLSPANSTALTGRVKIAWNMGFLAEQSASLQERTNLSAVETPPAIELQLVRSKMVGSGGGDPFEYIAPRFQKVIGLRVSRQVPISFVQPLYRVDGKIIRGPILGEDKGAAVDIVAPDGFVMTGLATKSGKYLTGLSVLFCRDTPRRGRRTQPSPIRKSPWIGEDVEDAHVAILGGTHPVVGLRGRGQALVDAVGLISSPFGAPARVAVGDEEGTVTQ